MGIEIERKFLINKDKLSDLKNGYTIKQGYIQTIDHTTVRVRIRDKEAFLTIKSKNVGVSRLEFEYPIPLEDADEMLNKLCHTSLIEKTRYLVKYEGHVWEIDIFKGKNKGLTIAEIELESEDEDFSLPQWVNEEVTDDVRYFNSNLIESPYTDW
ncbi:MAG: adenylate cyclase [Epsilonproteobacteria bacterium]|nr:MAG: adenylate cyclase [Campylobacterota bacterium]